MALLATASGSRRRHALACTWPSFFTPSSVTPGKGTARTELPLQPTHSCRKEALAGAELSQKWGSRRSPPCSWPLLTGFWMSFVPMPPVTGHSRSGPGSQSEPKQCSVLQAGLKEWRREGMSKRRSREDAGLHSRSSSPQTHLERQLPNWQGVCQAAVCPGTGSSTHTAERGRAICHATMPASSL